MPDFRGLQVWQAAEDLRIHVYRVTRTMRGARGLSDQLLRAAMSVPINIVEGNAHTSPRERARFLGYAIASVWEVEGHVQLSLDLAMISTNEYRALLEEIVHTRKMLYGFIKKVRSWDTKKPRSPRIE
jgi:four helix bundle protein